MAPFRSVICHVFGSSPPLPRSQPLWNSWVEQQHHQTMTQEENESWLWSRPRRIRTFLLLFPSPPDLCACRDKMRQKDEEDMRWADDARLIHCFSTQKLGLSFGTSQDQSRREEDEFLAGSSSSMIRERWIRTKTDRWSPLYQPSLWISIGPIAARRKPVRRDFCWLNFSDHFFQSHRRGEDGKTSSSACLGGQGVQLFPRISGKIICDDSDWSWESHMEAATRVMDFPSNLSVICAH